MRALKKEETSVLSFISIFGRLRLIHLAFLALSRVSCLNDTTRYLVTCGFQTSCRHLQENKDLQNKTSQSLVGCVGYLC